MTIRARPAHARPKVRRFIPAAGLRPVELSAMRHGLEAIGVRFIGSEAVNLTPTTAVDRGRAAVRDAVTVGDADAAEYEAEHARVLGDLMRMFAAR